MADQFTISKVRLYFLFGTIYTLTRLPGISCFKQNVFHIVNSSPGLACPQFHMINFIIFIKFIWWDLVHLFSKMNVTIIIYSNDSNDSKFYSHVTPSDRVLENYNIWTYLQIYSVSNALNKIHTKINETEIYNVIRKIHKIQKVSLNNIFKIWRREKKRKKKEKEEEYNA